MRLVATLFLAGLAPLWGQHQQENEKPKHPFMGDPKAIAAGYELFTNGCGACHGPEGEGGRGPNLRERGVWHPLEDEALYNTIQKGIPGGGMPGANLPEDKAWQIAAFVRSLSEPAIRNPAPGDPQAGQETFWGKGGCGGCHRIDGRGGMLGPDLSNAGSTLTLGQIRQAILDPDANGAAGYHSVSLVLRNGGSLRGVARNRTNYSVQLQDAQGNLHLLSMADVREMTISKGSPMPKDYARRLSAAEIRNLLAFLSRQSVRPPQSAGK